MNQAEPSANPEPDMGSLLRAAFGIADDQPLEPAMIRLMLTLTMLPDSAPRPAEPSAPIPSASRPRLAAIAGWILRGSPRSRPAAADEQSPTR